MDNRFRISEWFNEEYFIAEKQEAWEIVEKHFKNSIIPLRLYGTEKEFTKDDLEELKLFFKYNATRCTFWKKGDYWTLNFTNDRFMMIEDKTRKTGEVA